MPGEYIIKIILRMFNTDIAERRLIMKQNKLFIPLLSALFLMNGCKLNHEVVEHTSFFNAYEQIDEAEIMNLASQADVSLNYGNPEVMYQTAEQVVIARVDSIDGSSNYNEQTGEYVFPFTYGKMTILAVKKGNLSVNQQVPYLRMGAILTFEQYYQGLLPDHQQKIAEHMDQQPKYVKHMFGDDIDIEAGKIYLIYIGENDSKDSPEKDAYPIIGWEGGLREIKGDLSSQAQIQVLNNITGEWENLSQLIPDE